MNHIDQQLAALDRSSKEAKAYQEAGTALERLRNNKDFQKIVVAGYLKDEAVRLVHLKASPTAQSPEMQAAIVRDIDAIGSLAQYLATIDKMARLGDKQAAENDAMREELLAEFTETKVEG